eukprot:Phypoly_transcript_10695.p1 GENE.Phypoly_transcript_10695~~Phypoly_transcript_10695.p1  ORF type:complete len:170 (-),score=22.31 Phypoly_transcript_10695:554-1063(-)
MKCTRDHMLVVLLLVLFVVAMREVWSLLVVVESPHHYSFKPDHSMCDDEGISKLMHEFKATQLHNLRSINTTGKFIIYQAPDGTGLGNRIPPLISAALLALVVGRGLMVHWLQEDVTSNSQLELMAMVPFKDLFEPPFVMDTTSVPQLYQLITTANTVRFTCVREDSST